MDIQILNYLALNLLDMLLVLISSFIIILIGKKFFWSSIKEYLNKRENFLQEELNQASQAKEASEKVLADYQQQLTDAKVQVNEMIASANNQIAKERELAIKQTKSEIANMKSSAEAQLTQEKIKAQKQLKVEISEVAFSAAKKIISKELDQEICDKYVDEFIEQAKDEKWQA